MQLFEQFLADINEASKVTFGGMSYPKEGWCVIMAGASGSGNGYMQNHNILIDAKVFDIDKVSKNYANAASAGKIKDDRRHYDTNNSDDTTAVWKKVRSKQLNWKEENNFFKAMNKEHLPNILFDITGKVPNDIIEKFEKIKDYGYKVSLVWVVANRNVAMDRNMRRGREVAQDYFHNIHNNAAEALPKWIKTEEAGIMFDEVWLLYSSTNKREKDMTAHDKERLDKSCAVKLEKKGHKFFLSDKATRKLVNTLGPIETNPNNPEVYDSFDKRKAEMHESVSSMDPYLDYGRAYKRIESEYYKYGKLIVAVDFDDTLCTNGRANQCMKDLIIRVKPYADIIIWTSRNDSLLGEVRDFLEREEIPYDGINEDVLNFGSRKMFANIYLDDRGGLATSYQILLDLVNKLESQEQ